MSEGGGFAERQRAEGRAAAMKHDADRAAYARRLILHRCPEIGPADLAALAQPQSDTLPVMIAAEVLEVIDALESRMTELEERSPSW